MPVPCITWHDTPATVSVRPVFVNVYFGVFVASAPLPILPIAPAMLSGIRMYFFCWFSIIMRVWAVPSITMAPLWVGSVASAAFHPDLVTLARHNHSDGLAVLVVYLIRLRPLESGILRRGSLHAGDRKSKDDDGRRAPHVSHSRIPSGKTVG